jgi:thiopurine S-methyltransferase
MEPGFWHQRWQNGLTGFHQVDFNPHLVAFWERLAAPAGTRVFVPLCGKSRDLLWLNERHPVCGVELSPLAVQGFLADNKLPHTQHDMGSFAVSRAGSLTLLCGDFFELSCAELGEIGAVYDRAALIALPPDMRHRYVHQLNSLLQPGCRMLLVTMDYAQTEMEGPPFAVTEDEVKALFADNWQISLVHRSDLLAREARFRERGLSRLEEQVYALTRR